MTQRLTTEDFIARASVLHNSEFDYSLVNYVDNKTKILIICRIHGSFPQTPDSHLRGAKCGACFGTRKLTKDVFIEKAVVIHNKKYSYDGIVYLNNRTKISIICPMHGTFEQTPSSHLKGEGCPYCSTSISKLESKWLDELNVVDRQYKIKIGNKIIKVDGFDRNTNTIYEFYGDFWHGNPKVFSANDINTVANDTFGNLFVKTLERESALKDSGYNVISVWENDFKRKIL